MKGGASIDKPMPLSYCLVISLSMLTSSMFMKSQIFPSGVGVHININDNVVLETSPFRISQCLWLIALPHAARNT